MFTQHLASLQHADRKLGQSAQAARHADTVESANLDELQRKSGRRHQFGFEAGSSADEDALVAPRLQLSRHGEQRKHVPSRPPSGHYNRRHLRSFAFIRGQENHSECSLTLNNIPRHISVLINELPPALIIGSGMPLVGPMSSTTLILMNAWITMDEVSPSAR